jgi:hypothetical protein
MTNSSRALLSLTLVFAAYVVGYVAFREARAEVWARDQQRYVIFPEGPLGRMLYYAWRPLSYADGALTGMRSHIGPHRE